MNARLAIVLWKKGPQLPHLHICQPEKIAHHHRPRQFGSLNRACSKASSGSMGPDVLVLAKKIWGIHVATMMVAQRLNHKETILQWRTSGRTLNELTGNFSTKKKKLKPHLIGGNTCPSQLDVSDSVPQ